MQMIQRDRQKQPHLDTWRHSLGHDKGTRNLTGRTIGTPKSIAGIRDVHIPPQIVANVSAHPDRQTGASPDALLFPAARGGSMHPRTFGKLCDKARNEVGRPDLRFHDLRRTGAVMAARAGATLAELQARIDDPLGAASLHPVGTVPRRRWMWRPR